MIVMLVAALIRHAQSLFIFKLTIVQGMWNSEVVTESHILPQFVRLDRAGLDIGKLAER